jgi:hypothetical protein
MVFMKIQVLWDATLCQLSSGKYGTVHNSIWHNIPEHLIFDDQCVSECRIG